ncbi:MAG: tRNA (N(6)-L-threonylcarbamoyladenosine(37)-C(2))-methylthiotransferase [Candidatus Diapherotrites archaeon]|jgi:threonylcarbamoyladenosine tRNA methylthiotransferase CDKAL1|nr:tRNA (N(6)-L-threonylcarbamoyladenosine(37)-C(2))-methylthiotransferase [Candidatus Diapherotrites archaeon]
MKKFFLEGYGCSLNIGETEQIAGFLKRNNFSKTTHVEKADFIIINTCSVKMVTEQRMISRIKKLSEEKKPKAKVLVVGCLAATNKKQLRGLFPSIVILDTKLESLCKALGLKKNSFSPKIIEEKSHKMISIIPISVGCLGNCTYCATKLARGKLMSYSIKQINESFKRALKQSKEIWLTSQDLGCYGFDIKTNLVELLKVLLANKGEYRIRLGMMNPNHFKKIRSKLLPLFVDDRLYKFLHLPIQSGSDKILKKMNRFYTVHEFEENINYIRKKIPEMSISTDIIVGFPGETETDFKQSLSLVKKIKPNILNISRFGKRKGTIAEQMLGQLTEKDKKARSKELFVLSRRVFLKRNKQFVGQRFNALVSEKAQINGFVARTDNYLPVVVESGFGQIVEIEVKEAFFHFFKGKIISKK